MPAEHKQVVFGLFDALINFDIAKRVDEAVCSNAVEILLSNPNNSSDMNALPNLARDCIQKYKKNRELYSPAHSLMQYQRSMMNDLYCNDLSCSDLFATFAKELYQIYDSIEIEYSINLCALDKAAINMCIQILFGPSFESKIGYSIVKLVDCFSIHPHGLALLDYVLDVKRHNVYIIETIPQEWMFLLINKFRAIFERIYPTLAGLSSAKTLPLDAKCFFSFDSKAKNAKDSTHFLKALCNNYQIKAEDCVVIDTNPFMCKVARREKMKAVCLSVETFLSMQMRQDNWKRAIDALKDYGVFEQGRGYSYFIRKEYFQDKT